MSALAVLPLAKRYRPRWTRIRLVYGNVVQIQAAGLRGIRFFLFQIGYPVAFTQVFQGTAQIAQADLSEMLIRHFAQL